MVLYELLKIILPAAFLVFYFLATIAFSLIFIVELWLDNGKKKDNCKEDDYDLEDNFGLEDEDYEFIWGVKSWDDLSGADACMYTMNDIDIMYDKKREVYMLGVETAYMFDSYTSECSYLKDCLNAFTKYMDDNNLNKNVRYMLFMSNPCTSMEAESIEELYTNFKIFVDGFCNQNIDMNLDFNE